MTELSSLDATDSPSSDLSSPSNLSPLGAKDYLSCLQIVMVNTTLPANIGSAARAMHTMGLTRLTVVAPKHPIDDTSVSHAAGGSDILEKANIAATLESAISDSRLVFAASSRSRHLPRPVVTPMQAAKIMLNFIDSQNAIETTPTMPDIAIVFGREDRGLTNEELAFADYHIQIDANPNYPVLNVASAVQVIASFIFTCTLSHVTNNSLAQNQGINSTIDNLSAIKNVQTNDNAHSDVTLESPMLTTFIRQQWDEPAISQQQLQQLTQRTTELMIARGLANSSHLRSLPSRLSRLGSRIQLDQKEYQLLSALIAKLLKD